MEFDQENAQFINSENPKKSSSKSIFGKISILIITILVTWFISETIFYNINATKDNLMKEKCGDVEQNTLISSFGYSLVYNSYPQNSYVVHCGPEWEYIYHIDQYGLRKTSIDSEVGRPLAVGDSFTFGFGVNDNESFPALLNMNNAGIWGGPFDVQLAAFKRDVELLSPKKVVWSFYPSHIVTMMPGEWSKNCPGDKSYFSDNSPISSLLRPLVESTVVPLIEHSSFGTYLKARANVVRVESDNKGVRVYKNCYETKEIILYDKNISNNKYTSFDDVNKTFQPDRDAVYEKLKQVLIEAKKISDEKGIDMYFVVIPSRLNLKIKEDSYKAPYEGSDIDGDLPLNTFKNAIISAGYEESHIINLSEDFMNESDWQKFYYIKDAHWNKLGHEFVSKIIQNKVFSK